MRIAIVLLAACNAAPAPKHADPPDEVAVLDHRIAAAAPDDPALPDLEFRLAATLAAKTAPRAIATYRELVERWPSYPRRDEALFWYAHALSDASARAAVLAELLASYPASKIRPDALVALGDAQFEAGDLAGALASYRAVPQAGKLGPYAAYRSAWCRYDLGDVAGARSDMAALAASQAAEPAARALRDAARTDLARWSRDPSYARADVLYAHADFCGAATLYAQATGDEAAYAHVLAARRCEHLDDAPFPVSEVPVAVPPSWQRLLDATDLYLNRVRDAPELPTVQFLRARIFYSFGQWPMAARNFREVLRRSTDAAETGAAAALLLESDSRDKSDALDADLRAVCARKLPDLAQVCGAR